MKRFAWLLMAAALPAGAQSWSTKPVHIVNQFQPCLLYTSPSPRD